MKSRRHVDCQMNILTEKSMTDYTHSHLHTVLHIPFTHTPNFRSMNKCPIDVNHYSVPTPWKSIFLCLPVTPHGDPLKEIRRISTSDTPYHTSRYGVSLPKARRRAHTPARTRAHTRTHTRMLLPVHACAPARVRMCLRARLKIKEEYPYHPLLKSQSSAQMMHPLSKSKRSAGAMSTTSKHLTL